MINNNGTTKKTFKPRKTEEEYAVIKAAQIAQQNKNLDVIFDSCAYLEKAISDSSIRRINMKDVLNYLNNEKNYTAEDTKPVSQYNYMLIELANARRNTYITDDRMNIRVLYIHERLKTSFKRELHERIESLLKTYPTLLKWEDTTGANYKTVMDEKVED